MCLALELELGPEEGLISAVGTHELIKSLGSIFILLHSNRILFSGRISSNKT